MTTQGQALEITNYITHYEIECMSQMYILLSQGNYKHQCQALNHIRRSMF